MTSQLSKYPSGSVKEFISLAAPLMLSSLSGSLMFNIDRIILARYSLEAMSAAAVSGIIYAGACAFVVSIASITEVFVGRYRGEGKISKLAKPVWQMIWLGLFLGLVGIGILFAFGDKMISDRYVAMGMPYLKILSTTLPLEGVIASLAGFFISQGYGSVVTKAVLLGNLINFGLDVPLVFGFREYIKSYGIVGAGIATFVAHIFQMLYLFCAFFSKDNTQKGVRDYRFSAKLTLKCAKVAIPNAISHGLELAAHATSMQIIANVSQMHIAVVAVAQSAISLFFFLVDGGRYAIMAISSNAIGSRNFNAITSSLRSVYKFHIVMICVTTIPFLIYPNLLADMLISKQHAVDGSLLEQYIIKSLFWVWIFYIFDFMVWCYAGVLTSAGDTVFIMIANSANIILFSLLPTYYIYTKFPDTSPDVALKLIALYSVVNGACFYWRYRKAGWRRVNNTSFQ